jgi:hypothetical protein
LCPWRKYSQFEPLPVDAEIRTGESRFRPPQFSPLSSKRKFNNWDSQSKPTQILVPYKSGANVTKIDASYRNGCSRRGESLWKILSAERRCDQTGKCGAQPSDQSLKHSTRPGAKFALAF